MKVALWILFAIGILAIVFGGLCAEAWLLTVVWNGLIVPWLSWPELTFWTSVGVLFVINLLFGGGIRVSSGK